MTVFFYILKDYLKYVFGTILLTVFLFVLFDFIHKTTRYFAEHNPPTKVIVKFYALQIPTQVMQALPIAGLLAGVITMVLLSRTNEITALRAAGMGPFRIGLPLGIGGLLLSVVYIFLGELVVPRFAQRMHHVQQVEMEGKTDQQLVEGARWIRDGQRLISFQDYDSISQTLTNLRIIDIRPNFRPQQATEAALARYHPETKAWAISGVKVLTFKRTGLIDTVERRADRVIQLPLEPKKLQKDLRKPNELAIRELRELIERGERSGIDSLPYKVEFHGKLAYPFAAFVVSLIGLKFGYRSERTTETAKGVLLAFIVGISYWFILSAGKALGLRGTIHPLMAAWLPNVVILGITFLDAWRSRKGN
jgi:lipopolysaccharide export system permease protein